MFERPNRVRRTALRMLLMWVFALATSIVNACVIAPGQRASAADAHLGEHRAVATANQVNEHRADQHGEAPRAEKAACLKFCSEESAGAPSTKQKTDFSTSITLAPPLTVVPATAVTTTHGPERGSTDADGQAPVPIPIAFLRLTL